MDLAWGLDVRQGSMLPTTHGISVTHTPCSATYGTVPVRCTTCCSCVPLQEKLEEFCDNAYLYGR